MKRFLIWLLVIFIAMIAISAALLYYNKDKIIAQVLKEVNTHLNAPVDVGQVDVTLKTFPKASVQFKQVFTAGSTALPNDTLLQADEILLQFGLWEILSEQVSIDRIRLTNGRLNVRIPRQGKANYEIWKSDSSESSGILALESVELVNFKTSFYEGSSLTRFTGQLHQLELSGNFSLDSYQLSSQIELSMDSLQVDGQRYLKANHSTAALELNGTGSSFQLSNGRLNMDGVEANFSLSYKPEGVEIKADHGNIQLAEAFTLIKNQGWFSHPSLQISGSGSYNFTGNFPNEGDYNYQLRLHTTNTTLAGLHQAKLTDGEISARFIDNGRRQDLHLDAFSAKGRSGSLAGQLSMIDIDQPLIEGKLKSQLSLEEWLILVPTDTIQKPEGFIDIDVYFKNKFRNLEKVNASSLRNARTNGSIQLKDVGFRFKNGMQDIYNINSNLSFSNNDLLIDQLALKVGSSELQLEGKFINAINYAFFDGQKLKVEAELRSQKVVLEDFLNISVSPAAETAPSESSEKKAYSLDITRQLDFNLSLAVDEFAFETFSATDIRGRLGINEGVIRGQDISLSADGGSYRGAFKLNTYLQPLTLQAKLKAEGIQLNQVFTSFQNFGQDAISAENIYGKTDLTVDLKATMDEYLNIDPASLDVIAEVRIENGSLKDYDPMLALSDFADIDALRDVKFASLENQIRIHNSEIRIPRMEIRSNVMDLGLEGTHDFNNRVDYSLRLKMGDVLFNARKKKNRRSEFDEHLSVKEQDDDPNIYVKLKGPATEPDITLDRRAMGKSIGEDLKEEGSELRDIFRKEKDEEDGKKKKSGITYDLFGEDDDDDGGQ